jgi:hypothetical protein
MYNCNCNVKKEIKPPHWGGKLKKSANNLGIPINRIFPDP